LIDIIIVNYNSTDYLIKCLESIYDSLRDISVNIFVQDNDSDDDVSRISKSFPEVILTRNTYNMGFAAAVNQALKVSFSPYVVLLNPDTHIEKGFFKSVICYMEDNPDVGVIGPTIFDHDGSVQGSARSFPTPLTGLFGRKSLLSKLFPGNKITRQNVLTNRCDGITPLEADWVSGACMVVRRKAVEDAGLMDERFFMYWEDADWCKRMWHSGWKVVYFPQASIVHYVGGSSDKLLFRSVFEFHKSSYLLFNKYNKPSLWFMRLIVIAGLSIRLIFTLVSNGIRVWYQQHGIQHKKMTRAKGKKEKVKILRLIARLNIGGPAIHVHLLTKGLDTERFESTLVTGKISPQEGDMSYLFESMENKPIIIPELQREISLNMDFKAFFQIFRILYLVKPDIVHTHTAKAGTSARIAASAYNLFCAKHVRVVHTFHGHIFKGYFSRQTSLMFVWIERLFAMVTDVIIAISEIQKRELVYKYRIAPADKIKIIELGFDLSPFLSCNLLKEQFRRKIGIDDDTLLIGIIGRLAPIKNHMMFLKAAKLFLENNPGILVKFLVVGDGELRHELEAYCNKQGLSNHVLFCGWVRDVPSVYADLDILSLTSINEGTPVSIIEAMASLVPVIATNAGGVPDLLGTPVNVSQSNGFTVCERGILCRNDDVSGFSNGLKYLAENGISQKEECIKRARVFVKQRYSQERLLNDMETTYLNLMEKVPAKDKFLLLQQKCVH
jgi:GT2 family glycosyltransferase/glycosyltransferase involved in cell wall biosynthesis